MTVSAISGKTIRVTDFSFAKSEIDDRLLSCKLFSNCSLDCFIASSGIRTQSPVHPLELASAYCTWSALADAVGDAAGARVGAREAGILDVGAVLADGGARWGDHEEAADSETRDTITNEIVSLEM